MTVKMSERDKKILTGLIIGVVFFLLLWFGVRPIYEKNQKLKTKITDASILKQEKEMKVNSVPSMLYTLEDGQKLLDEKVASFYTEMTSTEIDRRVTGQILDCNLFPRKLSINIEDGEYARLKSYKNIVWGSKYYDEDELNEGPFFGIRIARVSVTAYGSYEDLWMYLNKNINSEKCQRVCRYQFSENKINNEKGEYALDMEVEMFMKVEADVEEEEEDTYSDALEDDLFY